MKKEIYPLICCIILIIFLIFAYVGPWYNLTIGYSFLGLKTNYNQQLYLNSIDIYGNTAGIDVSKIIYLDSIKTEGISKSYLDFFNNIEYLTLASVITSLICLITILGVIFNVDKINLMEKIGFYFLIITFFLTMISIIYFVIGWNNIIGLIQSNIDNVFENIGVKNPFNKNLGFWYTEIKNGNFFSIGPGYSWFFMAVAGLFSLISAFFTNKIIMLKHN